MAMVTTQGSTADGPTGNPTPVSEARTSSSHTRSAGSRAKRPTTRHSSVGSTAGNRRKLQKVSRACDYCRVKKLRCTGNIPCDVCTKRDLECLYDAEYRRGRPPTPRASEAPVLEQGAKTPLARRSSRYWMAILGTFKMRPRTDVTKKDHQIAL